MRIGVYQTPLARGLPLPARAHETDVGFDICTAVDFEVAPGQSVRVPTGLVFDLSERALRLGGVRLFGIPFGGIPARLALVIEQRTGNGGRGLIPAATIVDPGYRPDPSDEHGLTLLLRNISTETLSFARGNKVVQGLFILMCAPVLRAAASANIHWHTDRGTKRFGATGA